MRLLQRETPLRQTPLGALPRKYLRAPYPVHGVTALGYKRVQTPPAHGRVQVLLADP